MALALVGGFLIAVHQRDGDTGCGGDISNGGAHEARADDADLSELRLRLTGRAARALPSSCMETNSERIMPKASFERRISVK